MTLSELLAVIDEARIATEDQLRAVSRHDAIAVASTTATIQALLGPLTQAQDVVDEWLPEERQQVVTALAVWRPRFAMLCQRLREEASWYQALNLPAHTVVDTW